MVNHLEVRAKQLEKKNRRKKITSWVTSVNPLERVATLSGIEIIQTSKEFRRHPSQSSLIEQ
jgi:hypothetical protein